jgi:hypothetical protein
LLSALFIFLTVHISDDIMKIITKEDKFSLFITKWGIILILTVLILFLFYRIFTNTKEAIINKTNVLKKTKASPHKEKILKEKNFQTKGEAIKEKHKK